MAQRLLSTAQPCGRGASSTNGGMEMVKQNGHLVAASALLFFASTAGALTAPFSLPTLYADAISIAPEPASMMLLGMGLAALFVRRLSVVRVNK